jgi:hypothetical protein
MMNQMQPLVECHSEYQYAERPSAFTWNGERIVISEIIARWRSPRGMHFRVSTTTQGIFELSYLELEGTWEVQQP